MQGHLDPIQHDKLIGWVWDPRDPSRHLGVEVRLDGKVWTQRAAIRHRADLQAAGIGQGDYAFGIDLPVEIFDGNAHTFEARVADSDWQLGGSPATFQSRYEGAVEDLDGRAIRGHARDLARAGYAVSVEIHAADRAWTVPTGPDGRFEALLPKWANPSLRLIAHVYFAGTRIGLDRSPVERIPKLDLLAGLRELGALATATQVQTGRAPGREALPLLHQMLIEDPREHIAIRAPLARPMIELPAAAQRLPVAVVMPVYGGQAQTLRAIASVLDAKCAHPFELTVVFDNPADSGMLRALEKQRSRTPFALRVNAANLGFVASVNAGMALNPDRDVVLLNADTAVNGNWLDRLRAAAYASPDIGTATPFSNNATICSYPLFLQNNPLPAKLPLAALDALFEFSNRGLACDIPTAVGFCMYIRRDCLAETGPFDEKTFGRGYGEENDFCVRASSLGWRHVLAADVFVEHEGNVSFGAGAGAQSAANYKLLTARWPHYDAEVKRFIARDPASGFRRNVDVSRAAQDAVPCVCLASNLLGGGTERHVLELAADLKRAGNRVIFLRFQNGSQADLQIPDLAALQNFRFSLPADFPKLAEAMRQLKVQRIHFHQIIGAHPSLFELPAALAVPYECTVHDYGWICPQVNLIDSTRRYCGEPDVQSCERCLLDSGFHKDWHSFPVVAQSVEQLRRVSAAILSSAQNVYAPSSDAANRYQRHIPGARFQTRPHDTKVPSRRVPGPRPGESIRVVLIGAIGLSKGFDVLVDCARKARQHGAPLEFRVVGGTLDDRALQALGNVHVTGEYVETEVKDLAARQCGHISFFPNVWPETFSYTLTTAFEVGLFPVAFDTGAIAERIREANFGRIIELGATAESINGILIDSATS